MLGDWINRESPNYKLYFVNANHNAFDRLIWDKGLDVIYEQALRCPCRDENSANFSTCKNCLGLGWFFVNPIKTRMVLQSMNVNAKYSEWSEERLGTVSVSTRSIDKLSLMDRITLIGSEESPTYSLYTEILFPKKLENKLFHYLTYPIKNDIVVFQFISPNEPLKRLVRGEDYYFTKYDNIIYFDEKFLLEESFKITIKYEHLIQFYVLDLTRETRKSTIEIEGRYQEVAMPLSAVARRSHYVLTPNTIAGGVIISNSFEQDV